MTHTNRDRILALAGVFQAAALVKQVAHSGTSDAAAFATSISSLFIQDADSVEDIYQGASGVRLGLEQLRDQFSSGGRQRDIEITRYVINLLQLEKKLAKNSAFLTQINEGIDAATSQLVHFDKTHSNTLARLADIYAQTISTMKPRILVNGEHTHLTNPQCTNNIRTLLLAGIRSAVTWRQCGGRRLWLLLRPGVVMQEVAELLQSCGEEEKPSNSEETP